MTTAATPRTIDLTVELAATPEEVWAAIATGPGISAWLQPTTLEEREGGSFTFELPGGIKDGDVTAYEPPRRLVQETDWTPLSGGGTARLATEWRIETRSGSTSVLRMVMSGFGSGAAWDDEIAGMGAGMRSGLANLTVYLANAEAQRELHALLEDRAEALRAGDADRVRERYSANASCFGLVPLSSPIGARELHRWLEAWETPLGLERHDVRVAADGDIAFAHGLVHLTGIRAGEPAELRLRESHGFRRIDGEWYIVHEHASIPAS